MAVTHPRNVANRFKGPNQAGEGPFFDAKGQQEPGVRAPYVGVVESPKRWSTRRKVWTAVGSAAALTLTVGAVWAGAQVADNEKSDTHTTGLGRRLPAAAPMTSPSPSSPAFAPSPAAPAIVESPDVTGQRLIYPASYVCQNTPTEYVSALLGVPAQQLRGCVSETEERLEQYTQGQVYVLSEGLWTVAGDPAKGVRVQVEYDQGGNTITNDGNDPNNTAFNVVPATGHSYFGELNQQTGHMDVFFPPRPGTGVAGSTDLLTIQPSPIVPPTSATMPALNTFATNEFLALPGVRAS